MPEQLVTVILFDGFLSLEWEDSNVEPSDKKKQFERHLYDVYKNQAEKIPLKYGRRYQKRAALHLSQLK